MGTPVVGEPCRSCGGYNGVFRGVCMRRFWRDASCESEVVGVRCPALTLPSPGVPGEGMRWRAVGVMLVLLAWAGAVVAAPEVYEPALPAGGKAMIKLPDEASEVQAGGAGR